MRNSKVKYTIHDHKLLTVSNLIFNQRFLTDRRSKLNIAGKWLNEKEPLLKLAEDEMHDQQKGKTLKLRGICCSQL